MPRKPQFPKYEWRTCGCCGNEFQALTYNIRRGWGLFCSRVCTYADMEGRPRRGQPQRIRQLQPGESVPVSEPRRYKNSDGYIRLRWMVSPRQYVECYEHRIVAGVVGPIHVHHKNGRKDDNRPENLEPLTASAHMRHHRPITWDVEEAAQLYAEGWSTPQLGRKYGVDASVIWRGFQRRGIATRPIGACR